MVVFMCFEPILPPEMVVKFIRDEYMSIFIFTVFWVFAFLVIFGRFGHFGGFSGDLADFGIASEL